MQWFIMALWAVWTWSQDREQERLKERARLAALYVNPFLSACEDLQSRIYHILNLGGLRALRQRYPDGTYTAETLYLIVRYFGWETVVLRYGPYTQDPVVTRLAEAVRLVFATSDAALPVGPFNFFHPEQKALGKIVMQRMAGQYGVEFDTISYYEFKERLASPPLATSEAVQQSLEALRSAGDGDDLPGRARLAQAQHHLVDLLRYLESKEGYRLFPGERQKCSGLLQPDTPTDATRVSDVSLMPQASMSGQG
jgi:hypothetical protein